LVISKLQISNATMGGHEASILLPFCETKMAGFSNPEILGRFDVLVRQLSYGRVGICWLFVMRVEGAMPRFTVNRVPKALRQP
jgi:hypothetical protein